MTLAAADSSCKWRGTGRCTNTSSGSPSTNEVRGLCWRCTATPVAFRYTSSTAPWREDRLDHWGLVARMRQQGLAMCPLFNAPGFRTTICRIDWLHVADLGCTCDWLGQLMAYLLHWFPGRSVETRVSGLWQRVQQLYVTYPPPKAKLDNLTPNMLRLGAAAPKLKAYGEEAKGLVPVMLHVARELLDAHDPIQGTVLHITEELQQCYACVFGPDRAAADLPGHCRRMATLWVTLERLLPEHFRVKPKLHMFQELCELDPGSPARHATNHDEETGGAVVGLGRRRGGPNTASSVGYQALLKCTAKVPSPQTLRIIP